MTDPAHGRFFSTADGLDTLRRSLGDHPPQRMLIVTRSHVGDAVMSTGAVRSIIARFPEARVTLETSRRAMGVFDNFPGIDARHSRCDRFEKSTSVLRLRRARFDLAVILDDSRRRARIARWGGVRRIVGVRESHRDRSFTASVRWDRNGHDLFDSLRGVLALLGADGNIRPLLYPDDAARTAAARALDPLSGAPAVGVFVDASHEYKRWPLERFLEVGTRLEHAGVRVIAMSGVRRGALLEPFTACGIRAAETLARPLALAEFLRRLTVLVTNDTAAAHLADAVGTPAVVIYGPTPPERFAPYGGGHRLVHAGFGCDSYLRSCAATAAGGACDQRCLRAITVEQVCDATAALLSRSAEASRCAPGCSASAAFA